MFHKSYQFEVITPCFCAGADQTKAEIRPLAVRGALRWWFRALGGTREMETEVFGGTDPITASSILVRISNISRKPVGHLPQPRGIDPLSYILYFPSVSSDKSRWNENACYGTGSTFDLYVSQLRNTSPQATASFQDALLAFCHYGSIGMHITRGLGAVQSTDVNEQSWRIATDLLVQSGFTLRQSLQKHKIWDAVLKEAGQWLQNDLRREFGAGGNEKQPSASALGSTPVSEQKIRQKRWQQVPRQTSAVYLRPIKKNEVLIFTAFEAPHGRVLGDASRRNHKEPILSKRDFTKPPPVSNHNAGGGNRQRRY